MRSVIYEPRFDQQLRQLLPNFERTDQFVSGVEWVLARDPQVGTRIANTDVWFIPAVDIFPQALVIFYTFSKTKVYLMHLGVVDPDPDF